MKTVAQILVGLVAVLHAAICVWELFCWTRPFGALLVLGPEHDAANSLPIAQNQGLSNGFIAAGLVWGVFAGEKGFSPKVFFLACVIIAGVGAITLEKPLFLAVQSAPAAAALAFVWLSSRTPALR